MNTYLITFTDGERHIVTAANVEQAIILAQAKQIRAGMTYEVKRVDKAVQRGWLEVKEVDKSA